MANSARKIDWVLKQILTTNYYVNMGDKFKERCAKGWKLNELVYFGWNLA